MVIAEIRRSAIICYCYHTRAGGKCLRNREGAFELYRGREVEPAGFAPCDGRSGSNVECAPGA